MLAAFSAAWAVGQYRIDHDAVYAVTAKALAEGKGYHLVNLPGAPPQNRYPILYPALLLLSAAALVAFAKAWLWRPS